MKRYVTSAMVLLTVVAGSAHASSEDDRKAYRDLAKELRVCEGIDNALERLVCFDEIVNTLPPAERLVETPVAESAIAENEESEAFLSIEEMWQNRRGMWLIKLENGEVWRQTEVATAFPFSMERNYYFQKGMFNAHFLRTPGLNRRVRMVRDN